jgi:hypothetical protein
MAGKLFDELADRASGHHQHAEKQEHVDDLQRLFSMIREMEITPFLLSLGGGNVFLSNGVFARPSLGGSLDGSPGA